MLYDSMGQLVRSRDAHGNDTHKAYDLGGNLIAETKNWYETTSHSYDAFGNKVRTTDATWHQTEFRYDLMGRLLTATRLKDTGSGETARSYGVTTSGITIIIGGHAIQMPQDYHVNEEADWVARDTHTYDELGRKRTSRNAAGELTIYVYDLHGNVIETSQLGTVTRASFDTKNRKTSETDANGVTVTWRYDHFGRFAQGGPAHRDSGGALYSYTYNGTGELTRQTNTRGQDILYEYDGAGQAIRINTATRSFTYGSGSFADERIEGYVHTSGGPGLTALYRLFLGGDGGHFYTTNASERASLLSGGARDEGIVGYVAQAADATHVPLYRLNKGSFHVYTTSEENRDRAVAQGWRYEHIEGYVSVEFDANARPLYRLDDVNGEDHLYTTSESERNAVLGITPTKRHRSPATATTWRATSSLPTVCSTPTGGAMCRTPMAASGVSPSTAPRATNSSTTPMATAYAMPTWLGPFTVRAATASLRDTPPTGWMSQVIPFT